MRFTVVDRDRIEVERTTTEAVEEACVIARVMSRNSEEHNAATFYVEDENRAIVFMFNDGKKFKPED